MKEKNDHTKETAEIETPILAYYFQEASRYPLLTRDEEKALFTQLRKEPPDSAQYKEIRKKLINSNLRLVTHFAKQHWVKGCTLADLIGYGNEGLIKAVDRFCPTYKVKFSTYATWWVKQSIQRRTQDGEFQTIFRLPINLHKSLYKLKQLQKTLKTETVPAEILASEAHISIARAKWIIDAEALEMFTTTSFSLASIGGNLGEQTEIDEPAEIFNEKMDNQQLIKQILERVTLRERYILIEYIMKERTLKDIAKSLNCSRQRVHQIKEKAIRKLRVRAKNIYSPSRKKRTGGK